MDIEAWQILVGLTFLLAVYGFGAVVLGLSVSVSGLAIVVVSGGIGILGGRYLADRYL